MADASMNWRLHFSAFSPKFLKQRQIAYIDNPYDEHVSQIMIAKCDLKYLNDRQKGLDKEKRSVVSTGDFNSKNEIDEGKRRVANMGTDDTIDKGGCEALNSFNFENTQSLADNEMKLDSLSPLESEVICDVSASVDDWSCLFSANQVSNSRISFIRHSSTFNHMYSQFPVSPSLIP